MILPKNKVLFGGFYDNRDRSDDTWIPTKTPENVNEGSWEGTDWTQLFFDISPTPRNSGALVYDKINYEVILYGGQLDWMGGGVYFYDTWILY